jgi:sporulation protein YlmC with PRC-barrel domain
MDVYDATGDKIGRVEDVYTTTMHQPEGVIGTVTHRGSLFRVDRGVLGFGGKDLYLPLDVVTAVTDLEGVRLAITQEQAEDQYSQKPDFLDG